MSNNNNVKIVVKSLKTRDEAYYQEKFAIYFVGELERLVVNCEKAVDGWNLSNEALREVIKQTFILLGKKN